MPSIPDHLISIGVYEITKEAGIMIFFGLLMLSASYFMLKQHKEVFSSNKKHNLNFLLIFIEGFVIGIITGLVGAGGGFLIIPALVLLAKLSIKKAIATSLFIISIKSLFGFLGDVGNLEINWLFLSLITCVAVIGIFFGNNLNYYMKGKALKKGFAGLVFVMGVFVIAYEVYNL